MPKGISPAGAAGAGGGRKTTWTFSPSVRPGTVDTSRGTNWVQPFASPSTCNRYCSTRLPGLRTVRVARASPPGSTVSRSGSRVRSGSSAGLLRRCSTFADRRIDDRSPSAPTPGRRRSPARTGAESPTTVSSARAPGRAGARRAARPTAALVLSATPSAIAYFALDVPPAGRGGPRCASSTSTISSATRSNSAAPKPREVSAGVPIRTPEVYQAPFGSRGTALRLVTMPASSSADSAWRPVSPNDGHVDQHEVVVGAAGDQPGAALQQPVGQRDGVVGDRLRVGAERRLPRLGQRDRLGRHHVPERAAEHHRAAAVDRVGELRLAQHHAAARAAQRLVRRGGRDVGVRAPGRSRR